MMKKSMAAALAGLVVATGLWGCATSQAEKRQSAELSVNVRKISLPRKRSLELRRCPMNQADSRASKVKPFWIGKTEVTQSQWYALMGDLPFYTFEGDESETMPVATIFWDEAVAFCRKLTAQEADRIPAGYEYRLPTAAEWNYACRADGAAAAVLTDVAWSEANSHCHPHIVGKKQPNAWGLHDMLGNVREWCLDECTERPATLAKAGSDTEPRQVIQPGAGADSIRKRLNAIVIPDIKFDKETTLQEIVKFLKRASKDYDPEGGQGINFFIANYLVRLDGTWPMPLEDEALNAEFSGTEIPIQDVLKKVAALYKGKIAYDIDDYTVTFFRPENRRAKVVRQYIKNNQYITDGDFRPKMERIIIPDIRFDKETTLEEIAKILKRASKDYDPDGGQGINFMVAETSVRQGSAVVPLREAALNTEFSGMELPLRYVLQKVVEFYNGTIDYEIGRDSVTFFRATNRPEVFVEREWRVAPRVFNLENAPKDGKTFYVAEPLMALEAGGIIFREDAEPVNNDKNIRFLVDSRNQMVQVSYSLASRTLRVTNTSKRLDQIDALLNSGDQRIACGGGWNDNVAQLPMRQGGSRNCAKADLGFRIVLAPIILPPNRK
jgi:hypothetical protein